ncbi:MAG: CPBP family intramembrane metalloprotease [Ignavibacteria bacterium]|nr:CPBP family intramembrane metalloprotease [Ignavibacteria bacterium]
MPETKSNFLLIFQNSWWVSFTIFLTVFLITFFFIYQLIPFSFANAPISIFFASFLANSSVVLIQNFRVWHFAGLMVNRYSIKHFTFGFLLPLILFLPVLLVLYFKGISLQKVSYLDLLFYLYYIGFNATSEELLFRGVLFQKLIDKKGEIFAVFISSIVFAIAHIWNPNLTILALLNIFLAGVLLAICYIKTSLLWLPIGFHFGWNFWQKLVLDSPVSGLRWGTPLVQTKITELNEIVFGGTFGIEGGLVTTILLLFAIIFVSKSFVPCPEVISKILKERYQSRNLS